MFQPGKPIMGLQGRLLSADDAKVGDEPRAASPDKLHIERIGYFREATWVSVSPIGNEGDARAYVCTEPDTK
jgi:hypothetical protein